MEKISIDKSLYFYLITLRYLDEKLLNGSDDDIKYYIFEELDVNAITFLHHNTVDLLINEKLIPESVANDTDNLRNLVIDLIARKRTLDEIRHDDEWKNARLLAKNLLAEIKIFQDNKA